MRAIFLDIDGVICCNQLGRLEDRKLHLLRTVVQATGAKVVLSTDWRRIPKLKQQLIQTLHDYGMVVIGATPMRAPWQPVRPQEILEFLTAYNQGAAANGVEPITSFVAVDDRSLLNESGGEGLRGHFVHTRNMTGLTDKAAERMKLLLLAGDADAAPIPGFHGTHASGLVPTSTAGAIGSALGAGPAASKEQPFRDSPHATLCHTSGSSSLMRQSTAPTGVLGHSSDTPPAREGLRLMPTGSPERLTVAGGSVIGAAASSLSIFQSAGGASVSGLARHAVGRGLTPSRPSRSTPFGAPTGAPSTDVSRFPAVGGVRTGVHPRLPPQSATMGFARLGANTPSTTRLMIGGATSLAARHSQRRPAF